jgi:L-threonylcarbamoyladenylate synthase
VKTLLTDDPLEAARILRGGGLVAFPTETVYGLGADATDGRAALGIFSAKGRPADNPLIVHVADRGSVDRVASSVPAVAAAILEAFSPGPITVVLPRARSISPVVSAGLDTVGLRIPAHETAHRFLEACGVPVAAPSANRSGRPSPTTWDAVLRDLDDRIDCILRGPRARVGLESTVIDCTVEPPVVLRTGSVTVEALRLVVGDVTVAEAGHEGAARSPGTRHPHYAPRARIVIVDRPGDVRPASAAGYIGIQPPGDGYGITRVVRDSASYAHELYDFFHRCDALDLDTIVCQRVERTGVGLALMDRIERAAAR